MLDIEYKGGNAVVITTKKSQLFIDPVRSVFGHSDLNTKNGIEIATEPRLLTNNEAAKIVLEGPGEYEVGDFSITGIAARRHIDEENAEKIATLYRVETGDVRIGVVGNIAPKLSEEQLEDLGVIDILIIPVGGGGYTLDATSAAHVVRQTEPKMIIPTHFAESGLSYEVPQEPLDIFVKEVGVPLSDPVIKLKIKSLAAIAPQLAIANISRS